MKNNDSKPLVTIGVTCIDFDSLKRAIKGGAKFKAPIIIRGYIYKLSIYMDSKTGILWSHRMRPKKMKVVDDKGKTNFINSDINVIDVCEIISIGGQFHGKDPMSLELQEFESLNK